MSYEITSIDPKYEVAPNNQIPEWIVNEALLVNEALGKGVVTLEQAQAGKGEKDSLFENAELLEVMKGLVKPCFYVEYPPENLNGKNRGELLMELFQSKFKDEKGTEWELGDYLKSNNAVLSVCMSSLDDTTAEAFRYLNEKEVPVIAWVVVDDVEGYWTNPTNIPETVLKTNQILDWAKEHDIRLRAVGFDSEKPVNLLAGTAQANIVAMAKSFIDYEKQVRDAKNTGNPQAEFDGLLQALEDQNVNTEIYTFPRGLRTILGGIDITDPQDKRVIEMVYTGGMPNSIQALAYKVLKRPDTIPAFGIVSGKDDETPGRDFERITKANITGTSLEETTKGKIPVHLSEADLTVLINEWLNQEINLDNRTFRMRDIYLFAMNDAKVALMMSSALEQAFEKQKEKYGE